MTWWGRPRSGTVRGFGWVARAGDLAWLPPGPVLPVRLSVVSGTRISDLAVGLTAGDRRHRVRQPVEYRRGLLVGDGQGGKQPYDTGVPPTEFDDQAAPQALSPHGEGQRGSGGTGGLRRDRT